MRNTSGNGKRDSVSKLENDCMDILIYSSKQSGKWITLKEISDARRIPPSTIRTIFQICKDGFYVKEVEGGCIVRADVFDKIANKYGYDYLLKKMKNEKGRTTWHIACVKSPYNI